MLYHVHLTNKKALFYNLKAYYEYLSLNPFIFIPYTVHIKNETQMQEFEDLFNQRDSDNNLWIVKPGEDSNRGYGIFVTSSLQEIKK